MLHLNLDIVKVYMVIKPNNLLFLGDFCYFVKWDGRNIAKQIGNVILQQAHALAVIEVKVDLPRLLLSPRSSKKLFLQKICGHCEDDYLEEKKLVH